MSAIDSGAGASPSQVVLPPGVTVGPGRETSQVPQLGGALQQGQLYPLQLPNGTTASVFIPYTAFNSVAQVQSLFDAAIGRLGIIPIG